MIWIVHYYKLAKHWRRTTEQARKGTDFSLETLITNDRQLREDQKALHLLGMNGTLRDGERVNFTLLDWCVGAIEAKLTFSAYYEKIMRLHRPFLLRSHRDPMFRFSETSAVSAARQMLVKHRELLKTVGRKSEYRVLSITDRRHSLVHVLPSPFCRHHHLHPFLTPPRTGRRIQARAPTIVRRFLQRGAFGSAVPGTCGG